MKRIVIVGSGTGGTFVANLLARELRDKIKREEIEINLFGEEAIHSFQPAYIDVAFRGANPNSTGRKETVLLQDGIRFHQHRIEKINLDERKIRLLQDGEFHYDYLVLATGTSIHPEKIPGLAESSLNFHTSAEKAAEIWQKLQNFQGGKLVISIASVPYKCPVSANEASFLVDEYLRKRGIREKTELTFATPYPKVYPAETISKVVEPLYEEAGINVVPFFNVDSVDPAQHKIYSLEGESLDFDLLIAVPPHLGADVIRNSGIGDREGWIPTDRFTMRVTGHDDAYAIGDATNLPISKTGVVAHLESNVVAHNILSDLNGGNIEYKFNGRINCPFETGAGKGTFVIATYETPPKRIPPSRRNYWMKRGFARMYWSTLSGRWEPIFGLYFGETMKSAPRSRPGAAA